ncbi:MAG: hypothetical protein ACLQDF_06400 [Desulfomonilia bacterium]
MHCRVVPLALTSGALGPATDATTCTATALPEQTVSAPVAGGEEHRFISKQDIPDQWWTLYQCPDLDQLIRLALKDNLTLAVARATLRQAQGPETATPCSDLVQG